MFLKSTDVIHEQPKRPALRYHGGKWMIAPWIIQNFPRHKIYVEPFGGAASVLLRKARSYSEVYNDLDGELVNLFSVLRGEKSEEFIEMIRLTPFSRDEFLRSYANAEDPVEQARRTVVRSFMGFGSNSHNKVTGFRSNSNRSGTTPSRDWANYPESLVCIINRLSGVVIENRKACEVMAQHDSSETLHYLDPPYPSDTRDTGSDYRHEMTNEEHVALADFVQQLRGMVVISGYPCALYDERLFSGWARVERQSFADGARPRTEVLWMNKRAADGVRSKRFPLLSKGFFVQK